MSYGISTLCAATLLACAATAAADDIDVMTQNQYVGMDLIGLVTPGGNFDDKVIAALQDRARSMPRERAQALAALIHQRGPALVGLQEVYKFTCVELPVPVMDGKGCDNPTIAAAFTDQLDDTLDALRGRYRAAATVVDLDLPSGLRLDDGSPDGQPLPIALPGVPVSVDGMTIFIGVVDRDVILARSDVPSQPVPFPAACPGRDAADGCNYQSVASAGLVVSVPNIGPVPVLVKFQRGFVGVDAMVGEQPYRFVNTHLETRLEGFGPQGRFYQSAQSAELLMTLQLMPMPAGARLLLVGDMNSDPRDEIYPGVPPGYPPILALPPYQQYTQLAGFTDVWTRQPAAPQGNGAPLGSFSCCQWEDLTNVKSDLYERIDLIFSAMPPSKVPEARLLGESIGDKTLPKAKGLWPSDHASVAARIQY